MHGYFRDKEIEKVLNKKNILKNKKKILITGGTGFIGSHLALLTKNWIVHSLSKSKAKNFRKIDKVKYIYCDIRNKNNLKKIDNYYDYIVNLSGYVDHSKIVQ